MEQGFLFPPLQLPAKSTHAVKLHSRIMFYELVQSVLLCVHFSVLLCVFFFQCYTTTAKPEHAKSSTIKSPRLHGTLQQVDGSIPEIFVWGNLFFTFIFSKLFFSNAISHPSCPCLKHPSHPGKVVFFFFLFRLFSLRLFQIAPPLLPLLTTLGD